VEEGGAVQQGVGGEMEALVAGGVREREV